MQWSASTIFFLFFFKVEDAASSRCIAGEQRFSTIIG